MWTCWLPCLGLTKRYSIYVADQNCTTHTHCLHPYLWLLVLPVSFNHKDNAVMWTKPAMAESRLCSADPDLTEISVLRPPSLHSSSSTLTLTFCLPLIPSPPSSLLKVAIELWISLTCSPVSVQPQWLTVTRLVKENEGYFIVVFSSCWHLSQYGCR